MSIKNLHHDFFPREKAMRQGIEHLNDAELIAILLRTGNRKRSVFELSHDLIKYFGGVYFLSRASQKELMNIYGIGPIKSLELIASFELSKRVARHQHDKISNDKEAAKYAHKHIGYSSQENFFIVLINEKNYVTNHKLLNIGSEDQLFVSVRVLMSELLKRGTRNFYCIHNHPSGNTAPSLVDLNMTKSLRYYCDIFGIALKAHIIINSKGDFYSIK